MDKQSLKEFSKEQAGEIVKALAKINIKEVKGEGTFEVIATTEGLDRDGEVILVSGWDFDNFMKNPVLLFGHDYWSFPIGAVTEIVPEDNRVIARGVFARTEEGQKARMLYEDGILKTVSVGFIPREREGNVITKAELLELSFVPVPSNPEALDMRKQIKEFEEMLKTNVIIERSVVKFQETEKMPEDTEWDGKAALEKVTAWATDNDILDYTKFKEAFVWFDSDNAEDMESYKLLHHEVVGDKLAVNWQGLMKAMANLLGEDGGGIPENQRKAAYNHLANHYKQFDKEAPAFKSYTQYELDNLFPSEKGNLPEGQKEAVDYIVKTLQSDVQNLLTSAVERIKDVTGYTKQSAEPSEKAGRVLSSKNRATINNAVDAMGQATAELTKLLEATNSSDDEKAADKDLLKQLQGFDKAVEGAIKAVKQRIK